MTDERTFMVRIWFWSADRTLVDGTLSDCGDDGCRNCRFNSVYDRDWMTVKALTSRRKRRGRASILTVQWNTSASIAVKKRPDDGCGFEQDAKPGILQESVELLKFTKGARCMPVWD